MNITEANDVNRVLSWVLGIRSDWDRDDDNRVLSWVLGIRSDWDRDDDELYRLAGESAVRLGERAHKTLSAGLTGEQVREAWLRLEAGPWLDEACRGVKDVDTGDLT